MSVISQIVQDKVRQENLRSFKDILHDAEVKNNHNISVTLIVLAILTIICWSFNVAGIFDVDDEFLNTIAWGSFVVYASLYILGVLTDWDQPSLKYLLIGGISLTCVTAGLIQVDLEFFMIVPCILCISYCRKWFSIIVSSCMLVLIPIEEYFYATLAYRNGHFDNFYIYFDRATVLIQDGWYVTNLQEMVSEKVAVRCYLQYHTLPMLIFMAICVLLCIVATQENYNLLQQQCDITAAKASAEIELAQKETELLDSRNRLMLSQIQPHFLYNVLNSIYYLCEDNPEQAQEAISDFSDYLRTNLDVLKSKELVPFKREKEHLDTYLRLEKMRFGDRLQVEEDIEPTDFFVPELGLQPIVENAVKHGICQKEEGGTIWIRTKEYEDCYEVTIEDNGVGFDSQNVIYQGDPNRSHVGLENIKSRVELLCHGKVTIQSVIGMGTIVTISFPKEDIEDATTDSSN